MDLSLASALIAVGFLAGLFGSMLGLGGGIFVIPILTAVLGIEIHKAIGTSLVAVIATSSAAASQYIKARLTNVRLGVVLQTVTAAGAVAGGLIAALLSGRVLSGLFAALLVYAAYLMGVRSAKEEEMRAGETLPPSVEAQGVFFSNLSETYYDKSTKQLISYNVKNLPVGLSSGLFAGGVSGLLGIGGGIVQVPLMNIVMGVPIKASTATSNFMVGITAAASVFIYYANGHILPTLVAPFVVGVFFGARVGPYVAQRLKGSVLRRIFAVVLVLMAMQMILRALNVSLFN